MVPITDISTRLPNHRHQQLTEGRRQIMTRAAHRTRDLPHRAVLLVHLGHAIKPRNRRFRSLKKLQLRPTDHVIMLLSLTTSSVRLRVFHNHVDQPVERHLPRFGRIASNSNVRTSLHPLLQFGQVIVCIHHHCLVTFICRKNLDRRIRPQTLDSTPMAPAQIRLSHLIGLLPERLQNLNHAIHQLCRRFLAIFKKQKMGKESPLHIACRNGTPDDVRELLLAGAEIEARDNNHATPLHAAAVAGNELIVQMLLAAGADKEARTDQEATPLHLATFGGHTTVINILLSAGADIEATMRQTGNQMVTQIKALFIAASRGDAAVVQFLLDSGAEVWSQTSDGKTPLSIAMAKGNTETVAVLMSHPEVISEIRRLQRSLESTSACLICGARTNLRCQLCREAAFCGRVCQKAGWKDHKKICRGAKERRNKKHT
mmetsp:Transcript_10662/g.18835  ORF Transcript_10662/g.18835 Transcript_10662/m.18835 type:complete len:430 (+) Transcript_10662:700-1989(+)